MARNPSTRSYIPPALERIYVCNFFRFATQRIVEMEAFPMAAEDMKSVIDVFHRALEIVQVLVPSSLCRRNPLSPATKMPRLLNSHRTSDRCACPYSSLTSPLRLYRYLQLQTCTIVTTGSLRNSVTTRPMCAWL